MTANPEPRKPAASVGYIPQQDAPPRFGASLWSDGREVIAVGNTLTEALENLRKEWESK